MHLDYSNKSRAAGLLWSVIAGGGLALAGCSGGESSGVLIGGSEASGVVTQDLKAEATLLSNVGATGTIEIAPDFIQGIFSAGDTILRAKSHPECVAYVEVADKPHSDAGTLTISSDLVGEPGGPPAPFVLTADSTFANLYLEFPDQLLYNDPDGSKTNVQLSGNSVFPAIRRTEVRSPLFANINVTAPTLPPSGVLEVASTLPLKFKWDVPTARDQRQNCQNVSVRLFALSPVRWIQLFCSWPLSDGHGSMPVVLLREIRALLDTPSAVDAVIDVYGGEFKEVATAKSSYVIFPTTLDATTFPRSTSATFN